MSSSKQKFVRPKEGESLKDAIDRVREATVNDIGSVEAAKLYYIPDPEFDGPKTGEKGKEGKKEEEEKKNPNKDPGGKLDTGPDGTPIPDVEAVPEVVPVLPPPQDTVVSESVVPTITAELESITVDANPTFATNIPTFLVQALTDIEGDPFFTSSRKIGSFSNPIEFKEQQIKLEMDCIQHYDKLLSDISSILEPKFQDKKVSVIGGDLYSWVNALFPADYKLGVRSVKLLTSEKNLDVKNQEIISFVGDATEHKLIQQLRDITNENFREVEDKWNVLRMYEDKFVRLEVLPPTLDPTFNRIYHEQVLPAYGMFMDRSKVLSHDMQSAWASLIDKHVSVPTEAHQSVMRELLEAMQVRTTQFSKGSNFPSLVSSTKASNFIRMLINGMTMSDWSYIHYSPNFDERSLETIMDCLLHKLFIPYEVMDPESVIDIDNYLARFLMPALKVKSGVIIPSDEQVRFPETNYLADMFSDAPFAFDGSKLALYSDFLYTDGQGAGWANAGLKQPFAFPIDSGSKSVKQEFLPLRQTWFYPYGGKQQLNEDEVPRQYRHFQVMAEQIGVENLKFLRGQASMGIQLQSLLDIIATKSARVSQLFFSINEVIRRLTLSAITGPYGTREGKPVPRVKRKLHEIESMGAFSALMLTKVEEVQAVDVTSEFLEFGYTCSHYFNQLAVRYHWTRDEYSHPIYKKSEKLRLAFDNVTANLKFSQILERSMGAYPHIYDFVDDVIPDKSEVNYHEDAWVRKMSLAREFVNLNSNMFGFANSFYFSPSTNVSYLESDLVTGVDAPFKSDYRLISQVDSQLTQTVEWNELIEIMQMEEFFKLIGDARLANKAVKFNFPIMIEPKESSDVLIADFNPINFGIGNDTLSINTLPYYYRWSDRYRRSRTNDLALNKPPEFMSSVTTFRFFQPGEYSSYIHNTDAYRTGFQLFSDFKFKPRL